MKQTQQSTQSSSLSQKYIGGDHQLSGYHGFKSSETSSLKPLVIDLGTYITKVGFTEQNSGERLPSKMIPTLVGTPRLTKLNSASSQKDDIYVGLDALKRSSVLSLKYPVEHGIILDWEEIEMLFEHIVKQELKSDFSNLSSGLMMTEPPLNPRKHREILGQIVFEKFEVPKFQISMSALNALYTEGLTSGLVLDSGEGISTVVPIVDGYVQSHQIQRLDIGGRDINEHLMDLLRPKVFFATTFEKEFARDIKEQCCFIKSSTFKPTSDKKKYCMPDGKTIELTNEQHEAAEILFNTSLIGRDGTDSLQHLILNAIGKCDIDIRKTLEQNLILTGGTTMFKGFSERLTEELLKQSLSVAPIERPYRRYTSWIGASILASLGSFQSKWISKSEYEEHGINIVHKKSMLP